MFVISRLESTIKALLALAVPGVTPAIAEIFSGEPPTVIDAHDTSFRLAMFLLPSGTKAMPDVACPAVIPFKYDRR